MYVNLHGKYNVNLHLTLQSERRISLINIIFICFLFIVLKGVKKVIELVEFLSFFLDT